MLIVGALALLFLATTMGCATRVELWPPSFELAWGEGESSYCERYAVEVEQYEDRTITREEIHDCPIVRGAALSEAASRGIGFLRGSAAALIAP